MGGSTNDIKLGGTLIAPGKQGPLNPFPQSGEGTRMQKRKVSRESFRNAGLSTREGKFSICRSKESGYPHKVDGRAG